MDRIALALALPLLGTALLTGCPKKAPPGPPPVGWQAEPGWPGQCWNPKAYADLGSGDRRMARQEALQAMMSQWMGEKDDGVSMGERLSTDVETVLLGRPETIEEVSQLNAGWCKAHMAAAAAGGSELEAWKRNLTALPARLTAGECPYAPMTFEQHNYLDITTGWQNRVAVCKGDKVRIRASAIDKFRLEEKGPWIDVNGDPTKSTSADMSYVCNIESCFAGVLTMRFTAENGVELFHPVGGEYVFTVPEHGRIEVQINDSTWFDNTWRTEKGITDHASITYSPAD